MRFIGITGGVGAGKSAILSYLEKKDGTRVMLADEIAHMLMEPETDCYKMLEKEFSKEDIFAPQGGFVKEKLATVIFGDASKRERLNAIVHPAVKAYVIEEAAKSRKQGLWLLILEAALLIEEAYDEICDELWYIYTEEETRRIRLKESRGYSDEKIDSIFASQLTESEFRKACKVTIDNNGPLEDTYKQIEEGLAHE